MRFFRNFLEVINYPLDPLCGGEKSEGESRHVNPVTRAEVGGPRTTESPGSLGVLVGGSRRDSLLPIGGGGAGCRECSLAACAGFPPGCIESQFAFRVVSGGRCIDARTPITSVR